MKKIKRKNSDSLLLYYDQLWRQLIILINKFYLSKDENKFIRQGYFREYIFNIVTRLFKLSEKLKDLT